MIGKYWACSNDYVKPLRSAEGAVMRIDLNKFFWGFRVFRFYSLWKELDLALIAD